MACMKQCARWSAHLICCHPLLPAFPARIIFALRTLLGIACCAAFTLSSDTSELLQGQLLLGVGFIVTIQTTLGATIRTATRFWLAGTISTIYCLCIVNFIPKDIYSAVGATNIFVFLIVYTDLPVIVRRYSMLPTCIILLQWFKKPHIDTIYVLHLWASASIGSVLAVVVLCIPLPLVSTAHRELTMRMKFVARQARREITATVLLISKYHNEHSSDNDVSGIHRQQHPSNEDEIDMPINSYHEDDLHNQSTSFENLKDDHLLTSDIKDLHSLVNEELKQIERALTEISYEPYFIFFKLLNLIRRIFSHIPYLRKIIKKPSTLQTRLEVWATGFASLERTITGMLSLDHHHHAFVGQRQLINKISLLLDSTFNFLDSTLPYTISSSKSIDVAHIASCREKVEEALEQFFEIYTQVYENPRHTTMSTTDSIRLNTFLLLILRLVHVTITAAERSETPGTRLDIDLESTVESSTIKRQLNWKKPFHDLANYIGLKPSFGKFVRAIKTSLSVLVSAIVVLTFRDRLQAYGWVYWAPMTTALVSDSSEGSTLRLSFQRLMAVLLGSTYAYIIFLIAQDHLVIGIFISLFVAFMGYIKTDPQKEYFASVCAQSASIITFISNQEGLEGSNKAVLARTSLTFLGIFIHVLISNLFLPISARELIKKKVLIMISSVSVALKSASDDFCSFIDPNTNVISIDETTTSFNLMNTLAETERVADDFPALLEEALSEPTFWKRPFIEVKDRYDDISKTLKRIVLNIRFVHRCTAILKAETKLHFGHEAQWQLRRASFVSLTNNNDSTKIKTNHAWTMTDLRKEKLLQDDLDIPLTIFRTYSPRSLTPLDKKSAASNGSATSFRITTTASYQPVLEHLLTLEKCIQQVISLTGQLIERQATVDVGSFDLQKMYREDSFDGQTKKMFTHRSSLSPVTPLEPISISTNHWEYLSCCHVHQQKDDQPLPSLRQAVDLMLASLIQFLYANNRFIRTELLSIQSIGDILAFHTLSYAFKDMVEATTDLAKNARRIKHIDTRTLVRPECEEKIL